MNKKQITSVAVSLLVGNLPLLWIMFGVTDDVDHGGSAFIFLSFLVLGCLGVVSAALFNIFDADFSAQTKKRSRQWILFGLKSIVSVVLLYLLCALVLYRSVGFSNSVPVGIAIIVASQGFFWIPFALSMALAGFARFVVPSLSSRKTGTLVIVLFILFLLSNGYFRHILSEVLRLIS